MVDIDTGMGCVPINEVVLRGIKRIPPANEKGEELRDVILWLYVLEIARERGEQVAFISDDSGFWSGDDRERPLPTILEHISSKNVQVQLYRSMNAFVADHSLEVENVTETWVLEVVGENGLVALLEAAVKKLDEPPSENRSQWFMGGRNEIRDRKLTSGLLYKIDDATQFAELEFDLEILHIESGGTWLRGDNFSSGLINSGPC